jgi:hypothetical protein
MQEIENLFKKFEVAYIDQPFQTFVNPKTITIDYGYFEQYKNQLVVINFSSENWNGVETHVYKQLNKINIDFLLLTYNHTQHQQYPRMFYFPYWYHWSKEIFGIVDITKIKNYSLGCLNGNPRPGRIANYLKLRKQSYWNNTSVSFFNVTNNETLARGDDLKLSINEVTEWSNIRSSLPMRPNLQGVGCSNLPQLTDSYLHLVTETTVGPGVFTTEKTWKAIVAGVPFVMWGNPGTMNFLKQQGIDIYDDIIDHKYYDTEEDARLRLDKLYTIIDDLMLQGIDKIYNQLLDRVANNQTKFFKDQFNQTYLHALTNAIKQYK